MNISKLIGSIKDTKWKHLSIQGSSRGNTSFLVHFFKEILIGEDELNMKNINRLIGDTPSVLYLRSEQVSMEKKKVEAIYSYADVNIIADPEIFNYRDVLRYLENRHYDYLIIDEVRQKYDTANNFQKFSEVLEYASSRGMKVITSVTNNRQQGLDYLVTQADISLEVSSDLGTNMYSVTLDNRKAYTSNSFTIAM